MLNRQPLIAVASKLTEEDGKTPFLTSTTSKVTYDKYLMFTILVILDQPSCFGQEEDQLL